MSHRRTTQRAALVAVLVGAGATWVAGCGDGGEASLAGAVREPALDVAAVALPDVAHGGTPVTMTAPAGELFVVYFGYTSCPDICPTTMSDLSTAPDDLPADLADRVTVAMTTVDPDRDTDEVLSGYLGHFFDDAMALRTTDPDALAAATSAFGVQFQVAEHAEGDEHYDVAHTATTYVVDDAGRVAVEWPFGFSSESMASDLTVLLEQEDSP